jgi:hypothetical protein
VRKSAAEIPSASSADLERLHAAMKRPIDTSEISERQSFQPIQRDAAGKLSSGKSMIREAIANQMRRLHWSVYRLWRAARVHYPSLSQAAVHEFLKGKRQVELPSIEALLAAMELRVVKEGDGKRARPSGSKKERIRKKAS